VFAKKMLPDSTSEYLFLKNFLGDRGNGQGVGVHTMPAPTQYDQACLSFEPPFIFLCLCGYNPYINVEKKKKIEA